MARKLSDNWGEIALAEYNKGASDSEVIKALQITRSQFNSFMKDVESFSDVVEYGRDLAKAFWYKVGRDNLTNPKFQTSLWYAYMKNRFGWSDKVTNQSAAPVEEKSDDELRQEAQKLIGKHEKVDNVTALRAK